MSERFGNYVLEYFLAEGGMGEIFLARQRGFAEIERRVVLKRLRSALAHKKSFIDRFIKEARLSARLAHPNVVQVYDFGQINDALFLTLELVEGYDLAEVGQRLLGVGGTWPLDVVLEIAAKTCAGLSYVHNLTDFDGRSMKIVHCDISPTNIMLSFDGQIKLLDFGVARARGSSLSPNTLEGKLGYLSPEQCGQSAVGVRSDLFSLGVILWELLTGQSLYPGRTPAQYMTQLLETQITPPSEYRTNLPPIVDDIVLTLLKPDPRDRYASADITQAKIETVVRTLGLRGGSRLIRSFMTTAQASFFEPGASHPASAHEPTHSPDTELSSAIAEPLQMLIVDDEPDNVDALVRTFRKRFKIHSTTDPRHALQVLEQDRIDILLTDQKMEHFTGLELIDRAVQFQPNLLKIVISAHSETDLLLQAINQGNVDRYVVKPWKPIELVAIVEEAINEHPPSLERMRSRIEHMAAKHANAAQNALTGNETGKLIESITQLAARHHRLTLFVLAIQPPEAQPAVRQWLQGYYGQPVYPIGQDRLAFLSTDAGRALAQHRGHQLLDAFQAVSFGSDIKAAARLGIAVMPDDTNQAIEMLSMADRDLFHSTIWRVQETP